MGNYLGSSHTSLESIGKGVKRAHEDLRNELEIEKIEEELLNTPKRRKLTTTSEYIYQTLYENSENSDVTIHALGKEWRLHKIYLCQSGYFSSMFNRQWKESDQNVIHIEIPDDNIDKEALDITFGSLYRDEVMIKPTMVIQVLAAATLLSLDGLIQQCTGVMVETVSAKTVCDYHTASVMYGQVVLTKNCLTWLERNVMMRQSTELLREIDPELMVEIVKSPEMFVMQVEMDVYSMLKKWLFLQFNSTWEGSMKDLIHEAEGFFRNEGKSGEEFLETVPGRPYAGPFQALRLCHIINDIPSTKIIEIDCIMPKSWLLPVYRRQWLRMLKMEQGHDKGPEKTLKNIDDRFAKSSLRCGRVLQKDGQYCWRWTGFNFGLDILVSFTSRLLLIKRNTLSQSFPGAMSMQNKRNILYQIKVCSLNKLGHVGYEKSTGVRHLSLGKDQEQVIMSIDRKAEFPLHISCCFMTYSPKVGTKKSTQGSVSNESGASGSVSAADYSSSEDSSSEYGTDSSAKHRNDGSMANHHGNQDILAQEGEVIHLDVDDEDVHFV